MLFLKVCYVKTYGHSHCEGVLKKFKNFDATIEKIEDKGFRYEEFEEGREYVEM